MYDYRLVFWQRRPSIHQAPLFAALAQRLGNGSVVGVFQEPMHAERLTLGWSNPDYGGASVVIKPGASEVEQLVGTGAERSVHIFSHMPEDRQIYNVYRRCVERGIKTGLLAEGRDWRGWRGYLRLLRSVFEEQHMRKELDFVFAIGNIGQQWYRKAGYQANKIYPFCYVVNSNNLPVTVSEQDSPVQIVYIGRLVQVKRVDLLISALAKVKKMNWKLTVIGAGDESSHIEKLAEELKLRARVEMAGVLPNREVYERLASADLLVLTSRWDGWGAVVNEALHAGAPVVCSDFCGASDVITTVQIGDVFEAGNLAQLASCLERRIAAGKRNTEQRKQLRSWADCLSGPAVADYLLAVLNHAVRKDVDRPVAPWQAAVYTIPDANAGMGRRKDVPGGDVALGSSETGM